MTGFDWNDPEYRTGDDYFKFDNPGDTISGRIIDISKQTWADDTSCPRLLLDTGNGNVYVTAGQKQLLQKLVEMNPQPGDSVSITFTGLLPLSGGRTMKEFTVTGHRPTPGAAAAAAPAPADAPAAPAAVNVDALAAAQALQQEQR